jgi:hypothetical protein
MTYDEPSEACSKRLVADLTLFDTKDEDEWEAMYEAVLNPKYQKNIRNFSKKVTGTKITKLPNFKNVPIYLIPRERGGESYKNCNPVGCEPEDLFYAPISKGFSMNDVSSFSLGPVIGHGLCVVNAAFSKSICIMHLEGGSVDLKRKNFWKPKKERVITLIANENSVGYPTEFLIDGKQYNIKQWLKDNKELWFPEWNVWRKSIALCSDGDFHWCKMTNGEYSPTLFYYNKGKYLDFVTWKKECYIKPAYELIKETSVYKFLYEIYTIHKIPLGLVHPMARSNENRPITKKFIKDLFDSTEEMSCMPFVVAGVLLNVEID